MKKEILVCLVVTFFSLFGYGQVHQEMSEGYEAIPREKVFIHTNTITLFSGEYLYYKVYCMDAVTNVTSKLSKVAYVELIDKNRGTIFKHKVTLDSGVGQGDFFVPVSLPSGSYKLTGYTQWMQNDEASHFFWADMAIINPYQSLPGAIIADSGTMQVLNSTPLASKPPRLNKSGIAISLDKNTANKGDLVAITLSSANETSMEGTYSLSIRKQDFTHPFSKPTTLDKISLAKKKTNHPNYLPELRGGIIKGNIRSNNSALPIDNIKVALSIPGKGFITKIASTQKNGTFYFMLDEDFEGDRATFQIVGEDRDQYKIEINNQESTDYSGIPFKDFFIDITLKEAIVQRSVYNQIENGYFSQKPDTIRVPAPIKPFYGDRGVLYKLDDYKRFPTIKETLVEYVDDAWITRGEGETVFAVRPYENTLPTSFPPLIIVDGIIVQDQRKLLNYSAKKVDAITIVRDKYFLGADVFQGVIVVETIEGDFYNSITEDYVVKETLFTPQKKKHYFKQQHSEGKRVPDYRSQLLWEPRLELSKQEKTIQFYTSDNEGIYEVSLEGFTKGGTPISVTTYLEVR
ncbi:MAG: hypothetical protein K0U54_00255 [Bacteroidetes bacterium]|nr:hypothetical protein [Bacteroidota bacterium]